MITLKRTAYLARIAYDYYSFIVILLRYACLLSYFQVHFLNKAFHRKRKQKEQESEIFSEKYTYGVPHDVGHGGSRDV